MRTLSLWDAFTGEAARVDTSHICKTVEHSCATARCFPSGLQLNVEAGLSRSMKTIHAASGSSLTCAKPGKPGMGALPNFHRQTPVLQATAICFPAHGLHATLRTPLWYSLHSTTGVGAVPVSLHSRKSWTITSCSFPLVASMGRRGCQDSGPLFGKGSGRTCTFPIHGICKRHLRVVFSCTSPSPSSVSPRTEADVESVA
mmetsp:Transcript_10662/g.65761  ORF Transcript_10662/g.65761 Transcript_10662/m.65761 type:complete len:201 (+) Transcript_10662:661-1263(+)